MWAPSTQPAKHEKTNARTITVPLIDKYEGVAKGESQVKRGKVGGKTNGQGANLFGKQAEVTRQWSHKANINGDSHLATPKGRKENRQLVCRRADTSR